MNNEKKSTFLLYTTCGPFVLEVLAWTGVAYSILLQLTLVFILLRSLIHHESLVHWDKKPKPLRVIATFWRLLLIAVTAYSYYMGISWAESMFFLLGHAAILILIIDKLTLSKKPDRKTLQKRILVMTIMLVVIGVASYVLLIQIVPELKEEYTRVCTDSDWN